MWRWSQLLIPAGQAIMVFSTYVEMILSSWEFGSVLESILHVCGDDPKGLCTGVYHFAYSPRMWRWSSVIATHFLQDKVFSTYVEMIPCFIISQSMEVSILHVCGDDPLTCLLGLAQLQYSPRMWRWSWPENQVYLNRTVFSTYVEMILSQQKL